MNTMKHKKTRGLAFTPLASLESKSKKLKKEKILWLEIMITLPPKGKENEIYAGKEKKMVKRY